MIALLQRVSSASVRIDDAEVARIGNGLLALIGIRRDDGPGEAERLVERVLKFRIFADAAGRMNRSLADVGGGLLLVSQFTLTADTRSGLRPSFTPAAPPQEAAVLFDRVVAAARARHGDVQCGRFGATMQVALVNDGPVTFWVEVP